MYNVIYMNVFLEFMVVGVFSCLKEVCGFVFIFLFVGFFVMEYNGMILDL